MSEFWLRIFFENYLEFFPKETQEAVGTSFSYGQWLRKHQLVVMFTQVLHELVLILCDFFIVWTFSDTISDQLMSSVQLIFQIDF